MKKNGVLQDSQLPEMSEDSLVIFIDAWENVPCLWNSLHRDYKNKGEKNQGLEQYCPKSVCNVIATPKASSSVSAAILQQY